MKKFLAVVAVVLCGVMVANAQPRSIGGRIGDVIDVNYQHIVGANNGATNMVNVDLGLPWFNGIEAACTYDWIFPFRSWSHRGTWNYYAGVGLGVGFHNFNAPFGFVGAAGRLGAEYNFWFPLRLAIDWRPIIGPEFGKEGYCGFNSSLLYANAFALTVAYNF